MPAAFLPLSEASRLKALRSLNLLGSAPEPEFDNIVHLGKSLFDVPICLISLVDEHHQWFKAGVGLNTRQTPRGVSFCSHAIHHKTVLVVPDARQDARFVENPLVAGPPFVRFYAGAPLWLTSGHAIGTLCVLSPEPSDDFDAEQIHKLEMLAGTVTTTIAARVLRGRLEAMRAQIGPDRRYVRAVPFPVASVDEDGRIEEWNDAFERLCGTDPGNTDIATALKAPTGWDLDRVRQATAGGSALTINSGGGALSVYPRNPGFLVVGG